jgi:hypothetical protein
LEEKSKQSESSSEDEFEVSIFFLMVFIIDILHLFYKI